jgi:hypothetical protein
VAALLPVALLACGCSSGDSNLGLLGTPRTTDTITGTLPADSVNTHFFAVARGGTVDVTLTSAGPPDDVVLGLGVGSPLADNTCELAIAVTTPAGTVPQIAGRAQAAGDLCIEVFDPGGTLTEDVTYVLKVVHP